MARTRPGAKALGRVLAMSVCVMACGGVIDLLAPSRAQAIEVRISGKARLSVDVRPAGTVLQIAGVLRDETEQPLPRRDLDIKIFAATSGREVFSGQLTTDMQGRFQFQQELGEGDVKVSIVFDSTHHLKGMSFETEVHLVAMPAEVYVQAPKVVVGRDEPSMLRIRASVDDIGLKTPVEVKLDEATVGTVDLDHFGQGVFDLTSHLKQGANAVAVDLPSTRGREGARDTTTVRFTESVRLVTSLEQSYQRLDRGLRVFGRVSDGEEPLGSGSVQVSFERGPLDDPSRTMVLDESFAPEESAGTFVKVTAPTKRVKVSPEGEFEAFLPGHLLEDGQWRAQVEYFPNVGERTRTSTSTVVVDRRSSKWLLNVLGLLGILFGLAVLSWRVSLVDFEALWRSLRGKKATVEDFESFEQEERIIVEAMELPRDETAPSGRDIGGVVWDVWRQQPVPFAELSLTSTVHGTRMARAMSDGRFKVEGLEQGAWSLRVEASGFAPGTLEFAIPHDGHLGYFKLGMVAISLKIKRFYQSWVRRVNGRDLWGMLSPRQIEEAIFGALGDPSLVWEAHSSRDAMIASLTSYLEAHDMNAALDPSQLLLSITQIVEEAYFSSHHQEEALWHMLVSLTQRLDDVFEQVEQQSRGGM